MLTRLQVRNFKRFESIDIELGSPVVFIGPNNSGKTSALQALALWRRGVALLLDREDSHPEPPNGHSAVTVNRRDLVETPIPTVESLWHHGRVRTATTPDEPTTPSSLLIQVVVDGHGPGGSWTCGLEFEYANTESFYCRPLSIRSGDRLRMTVPEAAQNLQVAYLPSVSGLASSEPRLDIGAINVRIGEGRPGEVLRNLCHFVYRKSPGDWNSIVSRMQGLFGCELQAPRHLSRRGEVSLSYCEAGSRFDLSAAGRGFHQTLLLLCYMYANSRSVLLLDDPDAALEILRQRQTYLLLSEAASEQGSQIIAASHSEVLLNEAARRDMVIAFVGQPHRIDGSGSQVLKALREIGFEDYLQARQTGWVLYLEGSTDLAVLRALASRLAHAPAVRALESPFVRYVGNHVQGAERHFFGVREAVPGLRGVALFDRLDRDLLSGGPLARLQWNQREIENYLCTERTLDRYARSVLPVGGPGDLPDPASATRSDAMGDAIREVSTALQTLGKESPWGPDLKVSDEFLVPVFRTFFDRLNMPNLMAKKTFYELARFVPNGEIDPEVTAKLDMIATVAEGPEG